MSTQSSKNTRDCRQRVARPTRQRETGTVGSSVNTPVVKPVLGAVAKSNGYSSGTPELPHDGAVPRTGAGSIGVTPNNILVDVDSDEDGMMFRFRWS